jgi:hypothetical protein
VTWDGPDDQSILTGPATRVFVGAWPLTHERIK